MFESTSTRTLSLVLLSIAVDTGTAIERVRRLIEPAPFSDPALFALERDLLAIFDAVEEAVALLRTATSALLGPGTNDPSMEGQR